MEGKGDLQRATSGLIEVKVGRWTGTGSVYDVCLDIGIRQEKINLLAGGGVQSKRGGEIKINPPPPPRITVVPTHN